VKVIKQIQNKQLFLSLVLISLLTLALMSCSTAAPTAIAAPTAKTSIQFSWVHTVEFAGFYEAVDRGLYANQNIDLRLDSGGIDDQGEFIDPVQRVVEGKADFGIIGADSILAAREKGLPLVGIAAIYQRNPIVLISLAKSNIARPQDLVGKRVEIAPSDELIYQALLASQKIARSDVTEVPIDVSLEPLLKGEIDVRSGFVTNEPVTLRQMGQEVNLILPSDYGISLYSNVIFTTEETISQRPELVEKFLRATLQGYDQAINAPEEAAKATIARDASLDLENQAASMKASLPLLKPAQSQVGMMDPKVWETTYRILLDQGILTKPLDVKAAYTSSFLEKIYSR
jgi:NitT/TauT family transport system substrate-binding protein